MKTLQLECDEIADLKMMRDELSKSVLKNPFYSDPKYDREGNRRLNLLNKIIDHVKATQPESEGLQIR